MNTCYYCVLGGQAILVTAGRPATTEGFGTCHYCAVHACAVHGDKPLNHDHFRCADCWAALLGRSGLSVLDVRRTAAAGPAVPRRDDEPALLAGLLDRYGPDGLAALAPSLGAAAAMYLRYVDTERMAAAVDWLWAAIRDRDRDAFTRLAGQLTQNLGDPHDASRALGWPVEPDDREIPDELMTRLAAIRLEIALDVLLAAGTADRERLAQRGLLSALAVLVAFTARGVRGLDDGVLAVRGALLLPPVVLGLAIGYQMGVSR